DRGDDRDDEEPSDDDDDDDDDAKEEEHLAPADDDDVHPTPGAGTIPSSPLPISSPPPNGPTYVEGSPGSQATGIRQRDALPSLVHETEMPEMCLPLPEADLYGFTDMLEAAPGRQMSRELGYDIRDTWDDLVGAIQEIALTTLEGVNQRVIELSTTVATKKRKTRLPTPLSS
ncbi:hypothetical protein Tco_0141319, partial [Tanacetum coccineum]